MNYKLGVLIWALLVNNSLYGNEQIDTKQYELTVAKEIEQKNINIDQTIKSLIQKIDSSKDYFNVMIAKIISDLATTKSKLVDDAKKLVDVRDYINSTYTQLTSMEATNPNLAIVAETALQNYAGFEKKCASLEYQTVYKDTESSIAALEIEVASLERGVAAIKGNIDISNVYTEKVSTAIKSLKNGANTIRANFLDFPVATKYPPICVELFKIPDIARTIKTFSHAVIATDITQLNTLKSTIEGIISSIESQQNSLSVLDEFNVLVTDLEIKTTQTVRYAYLSGMADIDDQLTSTKRLMELGFGDLVLSETAEAAYQEIITRAEAAKDEMVTFKMDLNALKLGLYRRIQAISRAIRIAIKNGITINISNELLESIGINPISGAIQEVITPTSYEHAVQVETNVIAAEAKVEEI